MNPSILDFTNLYSLSETLQFELRPLDADFKPKDPEQAMKDMDQYLEEDRKRAKQYSDIKRILDEEHKKLIERVLSDVPSAIARLKNRKTFSDILSEDGTRILWSKLKEAEGDDSFEKTQEEKFRKLIAELLKTDDKQKSLLEATPSKYITNMLADPDLGDADRETLATFKSFACYLKGFQENRKNLYSDEPQITAVANRVVNQNFPKFLTACRIMAHIQEQYPEIIREAEQNLAGLLNGAPLMSRFRPDSFDSCLSQRGIEAYNNILGGFTFKDGTKIRGINETINQYRQQHPAETKNDRSLAPLPPLYKQILSDHASFSYIPEMFDSDCAVCDSILTYLKERMPDSEGLLRSVSEMLDSMDATDPGIFVAADGLNAVSHRVFGDWSRLSNTRDRYAEGLKLKTEKKKWLEKKFYSFAELDRLDFEASDEQNPEPAMSVSDFWKKGRSERLTAVETALHDVLPVLNSGDYRTDSREPRLREKTEDVEKIKALFDSVLDLLHFLKPLRVEAQDANQVFYAQFNDVYDRLDAAVPLFNRVRNYLTRKPSELKKTKLMFNCAAFAGGWPNETANACVILKDDSYYYLCVLADKKSIFRKADKPSSSALKRIINYQIADPGKDIQSLMIINGKTESKKGRKDADGVNRQLENYKNIYLPEEINRIRKSKSYIKTDGANFSKDDLIKFIDYYKARAIEYYAGKASFHFKPSDRYQTFKEFTDDIDGQAYSITFEPVSKELISEYVSANKIFLFQIYNKDFAPGATGRPNKFTLYWKMLFDEANLKDVVFKLNGEAELFLRDPSVKKPFRHRRGEKLVNRTRKDGTPIPEQVHAELCRFVNGEADESVLSPEARMIWQSGQAVVKTATHDIVKDRRFTMPKFLFHVPITINFKAPDGKYGINPRVNEYLRGNPDVKIIGIDRGERNLIYLSLIDRSGRILLQKSFNTIPQKRADRTVEIDYRAKLDQREKERDESRKNWTSIGRIKDLKAGYLSQVVHEIAKLMVEHNAIVVMEDLNSGFKRGRSAIEKQVYQNFERALITKLNYLVFKDAEDGSAPGYVLNGLQLTNKFESFEKLGRQSGFLFYVPAAYTSKIDPATGFVSLFQFGKYTNAASRKDFLNRFGSIRFDAAHDAFAFAFDYADFPARGIAGRPAKTTWTVCSVGERIVYSPKKRESFICKPTDIVRNELARRGIPLKDGFDLLACLREADAEDKGNAALFEAVFDAFKLTVQMRNSNAKTGDDYILSPVKGADGTFFDSRRAPEGMPKDADANGAYHIALKGLYLLRNRFPAADAQKKIDLAIRNPDWFDFVRARHSN